MARPLELWRVVEAVKLLRFRVFIGVEGSDGHHN